jgi:hypothetical protein
MITALTVFVKGRRVFCSIYTWRLQPGRIGVCGYAFFEVLPRV